MFFMLCSVFVYTSFFVVFQGLISTYIEYIKTKIDKSMRRSTKMPIYPHPIDIKHIILADLDNSPFNLDSVTTDRPEIASNC
ncbi:hypothetical protein BJX99DRAFT_185227 [Aspergillus californicus]